MEKAADDVEKGNITPQQLKVASSKCSCSRCLIRIQEACSKIPSHVWIILLFLLLIGINMCWILPIFEDYSQAGVAANSATLQGWIGCTPVIKGHDITTETPNNTSSSATANSKRAVPLARYKGLTDTIFNVDLVEQPLAVGTQPVFKPVCPQLDPVTGAIGNPGQAFLKVVITLSRITPDTASADVDILVQVMNALDPNNNSLLNKTGGNSDINFTPSLNPPLSLQWLEGSVLHTVSSLLVSTAKPISNYPWDAYFISRHIVATILIRNNTAFPDTRYLPVQLWTQVASQQFLVWADFSQSSDGDPAQRVLDPGSPLTVHIRRTRFTERYAVVVVVLMWFIAGFNFMHCMDNVFVRPRTLVDAFAVSLLFSLPAFRNTMPGVPTTIGVAIDMLGLVWAEIIIALCVIVSFIALLGQYKHGASLFHRVKAEDKSE